MACTATLKRSLEFDPVHDSPHGVSKRRRCMPRTLSRAAAPTKQHQINPSPFANVMPELSAEEIMIRLGQHYKSLTHRRHHLNASSACLLSPSRSPSPPDTAHSPRPAGVPLFVFAELKTGGMSHQVVSSMSTGSLSDGMQQLSTCGAGGGVQRKKDVPLFTLKQVSLVCERMMKEREGHLQEEYEKVLNTKLAEQYEAFLKFNQDQLHRRFGESAASYVS